MAKRQALSDGDRPAFTGANFSLRDLIACVTLHGMLSSPPIGPRDDPAQARIYAQAAYWYADAMLQQRKASARDSSSSSSEAES